MCGCRVIILAAIPLSIITAVLFINLAGQTLNTMTLGGFALAIGILVDNGTVVIENIERHVAMREPLHQSIVVGASEVGRPHVLVDACASVSSSFRCFCCKARPSICSLRCRSPSSARCWRASRCRSRWCRCCSTILMRRAVHEFGAEAAHEPAPSIAVLKNPLVRFQAGFERGFERFREMLSQYPVVGALAGAYDRHGIRVLIVVSVLLFPLLGPRFLSASRCGADAPARAGRPPERGSKKTQQYFAEVEAQIRKLIGNDQIDVMLDNIGLPYSGINIALSDSATVGPMDGEILISLTEKAYPDGRIDRHVAPRRCPRGLPSCSSSSNPPTSSTRC